MPLATQCPHCHTTFRVANDQLKLHAGLVRCGACQQTFNGIEYLLAPGVRPQVPAAPSAKPATPAAVVSIESPIEDSIETPVQQAIQDPVDAPTQESTQEPVQEAIHVPIPPVSVEPEQLETSSQAPADSAPPLAFEKTGFEVSLSSSSSLDFDLGQDEPMIPASTATPEIGADDPWNFNPEPEIFAPDEVLEQSSATNALPQEPVASDTKDAVPEGVDDKQVEGHESAWSAIIGTGSSDLAVDDVEAETEPDDDAEKPSFIIQAEKKQRRSRLGRVLMGLFSLLLFTSLLAQATYSLRDQIAAWIPQSKALLQEACKQLHCQIELPAQIESISIESNELQALITDGNIFSLALQLQNRSRTLQSWPMLELILNDTKDQAVLRRTFTPAEYLANKNDLVKGFAPGSEQAVKLYFQLSTVKAAGYHVSVFYP
jgi:predicted Zn finger-like uncharacterized protein